MAGKVHVHEIESVRETLEQKLNALSFDVFVEHIVWANGKLFVVTREKHAPLPESGTPLKKEAATDDATASKGTSAQSTKPPNVSRSQNLPIPPARFRK